MMNCDWAEPIDDSTEAKSAAGFYLANVLGMVSLPSVYPNV